MNVRINTRSSSNFDNPIIDIDFFTEIEVNLKHDSIADSFAVKFYFDPTNKNHAEFACVSHFHEIIIEHNNETLLTGYIVSNVFPSSAKKEMVSVGGYSKAGVFEDCDIPLDILPVEFIGMSFLEIATKIADTFKLKVIDNTSSASKIITESGLAVLDNNGNVVARQGGGSVTYAKSDEDNVKENIIKVKPRDGQNIKSFLTEMAIERNIVLSHDSNGNLLLTESQTNKKPIKYFDVPNGGLPGTKMTMSFNGQGMHSDIICVKQADINGGNVDGNKYLITNPFVPIVYRPRMATLSNGSTLTIQEFALKELAAELKNITLTIETSDWLIDGKIIRPNNIISVRNPDCFLYAKTNWFIESVNYKGNAKETIATIHCVLPEVYNKQLPKNVFVPAGADLPNINPI